MVKMKKGKAQSGPSSSIGLMRFFDAEIKGPKFSPEFVVVVCIAVAAIWIAVSAFFS